MWTTPYLWIYISITVLSDATFWMCSADLMRDKNILYLVLSWADQGQWCHSESISSPHWSVIQSLLQHLSPIIQPKLDNEMPYDQNIHLGLLQYHQWFQRNELGSTLQDFPILFTLTNIIMNPSTSWLKFREAPNRCLNVGQAKKLNWNTN